MKVQWQVSPNQNIDSLADRWLDPQAEVFKIDAEHPLKLQRVQGQFDKPPGRRKRRSHVRRQITSSDCSRRVGD